MLPPPLTATSRGELFMSPMIQLQSAAAEHRDVRRRYAASLSPFSPNRVELVQPLCRLCVPRPLLGSGASFPLVRSASCAPGNLDTGQPFSYCYELRNPASLWKASLRAHRRRFARPLSVLKPRWSKEPLNAASELITTRWLVSDNQGILGVWRLCRDCCNDARACSKPTF